ncbi:MAG: hypothetical protein M1839_004115 [Geoglossum umbratile]|nr:MAG: hypothetical protein M1839_004115 [Geoglossum umbratile]
MRALLLALLLSAKSRAQLCYRPDGSPADLRYVPCLAGAHSMCCRTNDTIFPNDICRLDGLCQSAINRAWLWRESCTDKSWAAGECLKLCLDGARAQNDVLVTECEDQSVCCDYPNPTCCSQGKGSWIVAGGQAVGTRPPTPPTPGSQYSVIPRTGSPHHKPSPLVLALAITLPVLSALLAFILYFWFQGHKRHPRPEDTPPQPPPPPPPLPQLELAAEPQSLRYENRWVQGPEGAERRPQEQEEGGELPTQRRLEVPSENVYELGVGEVGLGAELPFSGRVVQGVQEKHDDAYLEA